VAEETIYNALGIDEKETMKAAQKFLDCAKQAGTFSGAMEEYFGEGQDWVKLVGYKIAVEFMYKHTHPPGLIVVETGVETPKPVPTPIVDEFGDIIKR